MVEPADHFESFTWRWPDGLTYTWNVSLAKQLVSAFPHPNIMARPDDLRSMLELNGQSKEIDDDYAMSTDLSVPGIGIISPVQTTTVPDGINILLIDGWHRARKSMLLGSAAPPFRLYILSPEEEQNIRMRKRTEDELQELFKTRHILAHETTTTA